MIGESKEANIAAQRHKYPLNAGETICSRNVEALLLAV